MTTSLIFKNKISRTITLVFLCFTLLLSTLSCVSRSVPPTLFEHPFFSELQRNNIKQMVAETLLISYRKHFQDWEGHSILVLAILAEEYSLVPNLIDNNINVNLQDNYGNTALMYAASAAKITIIEQLLDAGADINIQNNEGMTALMFATFYNTNDKIIQKMLEYRPDTESQNSDGLTAWDILQQNIYIQSSPLSSLLAATKKQHIIEILKLPKIKNVDSIQYAGETVSMVYKNNTTGIMWVAKYNPNPANIINELSTIIDVETLDSDNNSALHYAFSNIHSNKAKVAAFNEIQNSGVEINITNNANKTPFIIALENNAPSTITKSLINNHNVLNHEPTNKKALFAAAEFNTNKQVFRDILNNDVDINMINEDGQTPIFFLSKGVNANKVSMYRLFKKKGANVAQKDANGNIPLHEIIKTIDNPKIVTELLQSRQMTSTALTLQANAKGRNILHIAAQHNSNLKVMKRIIRHSELLVIRTRDINGLLPINYAVEFNENSKITKYLMRKYPESSTTVDKQKRTLLMFASKNTADPKAVPTVLSFLSNKTIALIINQQDVEGNTALHYAAQYSKFSAHINTLINKGAEINIKNNLGQTPLMLSMLNTETPDVADALLKNGANISELDNEGVGALLYAAKNSIFIEHVRTLFSVGVNTAIYDRDGKDLDTLLSENKYLLPFIEINYEEQE